MHIQNFLKNNVINHASQAQTFVSTFSEGENEFHRENYLSSKLIVCTMEMQKKRNKQNGNPFYIVDCFVIVPKIESKTDYNFLQVKCTFLFCLSITIFGLSRTTDSTYDCIYQQ